LNVIESSRIFDQDETVSVTAVAALFANDGGGWTSSSMGGAGWPIGAVLGGSFGPSMLDEPGFT
ncbi:MAG TPA: hypothetical protein VLK58_20815, partial [Conexibacter sp.]|nr:hypothetical protein [Conexibacter sp.]